MALDSEEVAYFRLRLEELDGQPVDEFGSSRLTVVEKVNIVNSKTVYLSGKRCPENVDWTKTDAWRMEEMKHLPSKLGVGYRFNEETHRVELVEVNGEESHIRERREYLGISQRRMNSAVFA